MRSKGAFVDLWISVLLFVLIVLCCKNEVQAFSSSPPTGTFVSTRRISLPIHQATNKDDDDGVLTDLDARVLQEMLQDSKKLNLQDEQNMRSLLERGIKAKEKVNSKDTEKEESPFQSEILQTLGSTKLWKAFERKAEDWVESAKIYINNKIERDAKLLASLGIFIGERIQQDIARALPATATQTWKPKNQFLLGNTTSREEMTASERIRQDMSTPLDEIQAVGREIKDIFRSATAPPPEVQGEELEDVEVKKTPFSRNLKSTATSSKYKVNDKTKFEKVYKRKQETTLKREKENVVQSTTRLANEVVDSAYQIKREVQVEVNQPGYKTKTFRDNASKASRMLAGGAAKILGGAKNLAVAAIEATRKEESMATPKLPETSNYAEPSPTVEAPPPPRQQQQDQRVPWTSANFGAAPPPSLARLELEDTLETEIERLASTLGECIANPQLTWLDPNLLIQDDSFQNFSEAALEKVVVTMVQAQQELQVTDDEDPIASLQNVRSLLNQVIGISSTESTNIAEYLQQALIGDEESAVLLQLEVYQQKFEQLYQQELAMQQQASTTMAQETETTAPWYVDDDVQDDVQEATTWYVDQDDTDGETITMSDDSSVVLEPTYNQKDVEIEEVELLEEGPVSVSRQTVIEEVEILDTTVPEGVAVVDVGGADVSSDFVQTSNDYSVMAEIVSDDDFEVAMGGGRASGANNENNFASAQVNEMEEEEEEDEPNPVAMLALRGLDVVLLAGEKTAGAIPSLINLGGTVSDRVSNVKSDGLGSEGWDIISSAQRGDNKY